MPIYEVDGKAPTIDDSVYIADGATVIGDVTLGPQVSVWTGAVLRGDNDYIKIAAGTNIQEGAVLHADPDFPINVGNHVTIGHQAMLHGCTIGPGALIGIQAVVLNGALIGENALVGAGAIVTEGKSFPGHCLILGAPARAIREVSPAMLAVMQRDNADYIARAKRYKATLRRLD
ncbi:MAG: gamma carbonic anhydrase family protein [Gammaproteobacteria bacterium]|nr:gamma carbonic anhydrase family protein [Gammaproteobacteria bacterium]